MKVCKSDVLTSGWHVCVLAGLGMREKHKGRAGPRVFLGERGSCWAAARLNTPRTEFCAQARQGSRVGPETATSTKTFKFKRINCYQQWLTLDWISLLCYCLCYFQSVLLLIVVQSTAGLRNIIQENCRKSFSYMIKYNSSSQWTQCAVDAITNESS